MRIVKRDDALRDRLLSLKLLFGLAENALGQFNVLKKPLLELGRLIRARSTQRLESFATLSHGMLGQLGHSPKDFFSLLFALLGVGLGRLTPVRKSSFGCPHMIGDLFTQTSCRAGKRLNGLIDHTHIVGIADVSLQGGRIDPNPPWLYRTRPQQLLDQMLVTTCDPILAKSLIELNQSRGVRDWIHQRQPAEIPPRQSLSLTSLSTSS